MSEKMPETKKEFIAQNPAQGNFRRVLCVCTGGILRSPTAAFVFSQPPYNFNTRSAGTKDFALIQVTEHLIGWADEILCMEGVHEGAVRLAWRQSTHYPKSECPPIQILNIPDIYDYREPALIARLKRSYKQETTLGISRSD
jgi:predicted protein tyrosine phosphatase